MYKLIIIIDTNVDYFAVNIFTIFKDLKHHYFYGYTYYLNQLVKR